MSKFEAARLQEGELERISNLVLDLEARGESVWPTEIGQPLLRHIAYLDDEKERVMEERDAAIDALADRRRQAPLLASKAKSALDEVRDLKMQMDDIRAALGIPSSAAIVPAILSLLTQHERSLGRKDGQ